MKALPGLRVFYPLGLGAGLGLGGLLPLSPPDGFPVVLGPFGGLVPLFAIKIISFKNKSIKNH